jgi:hypothetical protein
MQEDELAVAARAATLPELQSVADLTSASRPPSKVPPRGQGPRAEGAYRGLRGPVGGPGGLGGRGLRLHAWRLLNSAWRLLSSPSTAHSSSAQWETTESGSRKAEGAQG